jgi:peptidoglycan hydrolase-like protein with peptidoglycan-binding domain
MTEEIAQSDAADKMRPKPSHIAPENTVAVGDEGDQVERTYEYLRRFGYFPNERLARQYPMWRSAVAFDLENPRTYGEKLRTAVGLFQQANGLPVTGDVDEDTLDLMNQPRCGFPDIVVEGVGEFVAQGNRWNVNPVSYSYTNTTPDLPVADVRAAVRGAFDRWSAVSSLNFVENPNGGDIRIGFFSGDHGDGSAFDGPSGVLAHCFYPPPNGGAIAGDCHFDEAETWSVNNPPSGIDLPTVALHEMGHGLGLAHSSVTSAVMYPYYGGPRRELADDDIAGIRSIYGARFRWASLSGAVFDPVVVSNADGRLEAFVRGTDGALWHIWQTKPNNGWSGWHSLGGVIQGAPTVGRNADGRLEVFARGTDGALWHIWQTKPNNGWSGWASLGGWIVNPVVGSNADGRLEVFAQGADGALWHIWQTKPNNGWSGWASLGGTLTSPVSVARNADGRLEVFVRGTDGAVWHIWQTKPNNGWSRWSSRGGVIIGRPAVGPNADGRLEIFARGTDNALWHMWQTAPNNGWSGWASLGGIIDQPSVASNADGRLEVFVRGADNALWHIWQTRPNNGWSGWSTLSGQLIGGPVAARNADGRLEVFVKGTDNALWHTWQSRPNNGWT